LDRIVLDTNVLLSAFISPHGESAKAVEFVYAKDKTVDICYNEAIFDEYREKFTDDKFKKYNFDINELENIINQTKIHGIKIEPVPSDVLIRDEEDRIFYDTAKDSGAILITGDKDLLSLREDFIFTPKMFIDRHERMLDYKRIWENQSLQRDVNLPEFD
jgi:putative PIN family toxin of toxin-antitoxin system